MFSKNQCLSKLSPCALGSAFAIVKALGMMLYVACLAGSDTKGYPVIRSIGAVYQGDAILVKVLIAGVAGLVLGFICGLLVAWVYNLVVSCCCGDKQCNIHGNGNGKGKQ